MTAADPLRQDCERRAKKALPCDSDCFRMFSDESNAHWPSCAAFHRELVADALEEAIRPLVEAQQTEQEMHNAWRKRAEEAETQLATVTELFRWAYSHAQCDGEATTGEQEDFSDMKDKCRSLLFAPYATPQAEPEEPRK